MILLYPTVNHEKLCVSAVKVTDVTQELWKSVFDVINYSFSIHRVEGELAPTSEIPSVAGSSKILSIAWIEASVPPGIPAHV